MHVRRVELLSVRIEAMRGDDPLGFGELLNIIALDIGGLDISGLDGIKPFGPQPRFIGFDTVMVDNLVTMDRVSELITDCNHGSSLGEDAGSALG